MKSFDDLSKDPVGQLLLGTVMLNVTYLDGTTGTGTGFFFRFCERKDSLYVPAIVTNRHVACYAASIMFSVRRSDVDGEQELLGDSIPISLDPPVIIEHPDKNVDLCIIPIAAIIRRLVSEGDNPKFRMLGQNLVIDSASSLTLMAYEEVLMIGYPTGLWDHVNDLPILRRGVTASHPALNWQGRQEVLIDAACFPGSSGSPVFINRTLQIGFQSTERPQQPFMKTDLLLLGILHAGPLHTVEGVMQEVARPMNKTLVPVTDVMMNLGYVIKSSKLMDFVAMFDLAIDSGDLRFTLKSGVKN